MDDKLPVTVRDAVLTELIAGIRTDLDAIASTPSLADPEVERDVRLAAESLDDAACHMRRLKHQRLRSLFGEGEQ